MPKSKRGSLNLVKSTCLETLFGALLARATAHQHMFIPVRVEVGLAIRLCSTFCAAVVFAASFGFRDVEFRVGTLGLEFIKRTHIHTCIYIYNIRVYAADQEETIMVQPNQAVEVQNRSITRGLLYAYPWCMPS